MTRTIKASVILIAALAIVAVVGTPQVNAAATIVINNLDGAGEGFNDGTPFTAVGGNKATTLGAARLAAFRYAAELWGACVNSSVTITIDAQMDPQFCSAGSAILGSAGAITIHRDFVNAPVAATWYPQALANSLAGVDLSASSDVNATFNSNLNGNPACLGGIGWYYGFDGNPGSDIDFVTVVLHEIGHGLGFQTFVSLATGAKFGGFDDTYMLNLERHFGIPADYPSMSNAQRVAASISDPNLHWTGLAVDAQGPVTLSSGMSNGHVRMHGPNPNQPGSSVSHFSTALFPSELMEPSYTGADHDVSMAANLMDDIGWSLENKTLDVCDGHPLELTHPSGPPPIFASDDGQERGLFITAIKDFDLCAIAMNVDHALGQTVTARVYAANGTTRGALLASGSATITFTGEKFHYIPISYTLQACTEYDITVQFGTTNAWHWWSENIVAEPYDVGGVIRVRDAESGGGASNFALPHYALIGEASNPDVLSELDHPNGFGTFSDGSTRRGAYITANKTVRLCSVGMRLTNAFSGFPQELRANVFNATGTTRGSLVATGTILTSAAGFVWHDIPVNAVLEEGGEYDIEVQFAATTWGGAFESGLLPFTVDDAIIVRDGEFNGTASNTILPEMRVQWDDGAGGDPLDLVGPFHGPAEVTTTQPNFDYGVYVRSLTDTELYSLGWMADLPVGATVGANVYEATGTTRGALISSGTIIATEAGMRWHDIPVSASLVSGQNYDLEIDIGAVNEWNWWSDLGSPTKPYIAYGVLEMVDSEQGGSASNVALIHLRTGTCTTTPTAIDDGPVTAPKFTLSAPYPNPVSSVARIPFSLDEASTVDVTVYDVRGRRVAELVKNKRFAAGPGVIDFNSANLATGVYFIKMNTPSKSLSRKITILR